MLIYDYFGLQIQQKHDFELQSICKKLMYVQGCLKREQERVKSLLLERDRKIQIQSAHLEASEKKFLKKDAAHPKIERLSSAGGVSSAVPCPDDAKQTQNSSKSGLSGSTTSLDRHRPGAARLHGSFRQYKKEREKSRLLQQQSLQSSNPNIPLDLTLSCKDRNKDLPLHKTQNSNLSSSSTNSSPSTLPRQQVVIRPSHHPPLRQTRSCSGATETRLSLDIKSIDQNESSTLQRSLSPGRISLSVSDKATYNSSTFPRKGILKATSSYNGSSPVTISMNNKNNTIIENFSQIGSASMDQKYDYNSRSIIESLKKEELNDKLVICTQKSKVKSNPLIEETTLDKSKTNLLGNEEKSDSGRESDDCPSSTSEQSPSDNSLGWKSVPIIEQNPYPSPIKSIDCSLTEEKPATPVSKPIRFKHRSSLTSSGSSANSSFDASYDSGLSLTKDYSSSTSDSSLSEQYKILPKDSLSNNSNSHSSKPPIQTTLGDNFTRNVVDKSNNTSSIRKKKPMPPPRSSMTRLTTVNKETAPDLDKPASSIRDISKQPVIKQLDSAIRNSTFSTSSSGNLTKPPSPPDPLRSLKQSALNHKRAKECFGHNVSKIEHKFNGNAVQIEPENSVKALENEKVESKQRYKSEAINTASGLSQKDLQEISSSLFNLNKNNESKTLEPPKLVPKSILHTNSHDDAAQALDLLINTNTINEFNLSSRKSSKRVKFHPEVKLSKEKEINIDENSKNKPTTNKEEGELSTKIQNSSAVDMSKKYINPKKKEDISYYEPYV